MSPAPRSLHVNPGEVEWQERYPLDITTGAPQKLFRHLVDAVHVLGLAVIDPDEPQIVAQAIGDTGTVEGSLLCESHLVETGNPIIRLVGLALSLLGIGLLLWSLQAGLSLGLLTLGIIFLFIGVYLMRLHAFRSNLVFIHLKGEAYRSGLNAGTRMPTEIADTQRLSVISELRVSFYGAAVETRNTGDVRSYSKSLSSPPVRGLFQMLIDNVATSVLPKVQLQKSWEQTRHEYSSPLVIKETVTHEVLVRCGYCKTLNPDEEISCQNCGARLK